MRFRSKVAPQSSRPKHRKRKKPTAQFLENEGDSAHRKVEMTALARRAVPRAYSSKIDGRRLETLERARARDGSRARSCALPASPRRALKSTPESRENEQVEREEDCGYTYI